MLSKSKKSKSKKTNIESANCKEALKTKSAKKMKRKITVDTKAMESEQIMETKSLSFKNNDKKDNKAVKTKSAKKIDRKITVDINTVKNERIKEPSTARKDRKVQADTNTIKNEQLKKTSSLSPKTNDKKGIKTKSAKKVGRKTTVDTNTIKNGKIKKSTQSLKTKDKNSKKSLLTKKVDRKITVDTNTTKNEQIKETSVLSFKTSDKSDKKDLKTKSANKVYRKITVDSNSMKNGQIKKISAHPLKTNDKPSFSCNCKSKRFSLKKLTILTPSVNNSSVKRVSPIKISLKGKLQINKPSNAGTLYAHDKNKIKLLDNLVIDSNDLERATNKASASKHISTQKKVRIMHTGQVVDDKHNVLGSNSVLKYSVLKDSVLKTGKASNETFACIAKNLCKKMPADPIIGRSLKTDDEYLSPYNTRSKFITIKKPTKLSSAIDSTPRCVIPMKLSLKRNVKSSIPTKAVSFKEDNQPSNDKHTKYVGDKISTDKIVGKLAVKKTNPHASMMDKKSFASNSKSKNLALKEPDRLFHAVKSHIRALDHDLKSSSTANSPEGRNSFLLDMAKRFSASQISNSQAPTSSKTISSFAKYLNKVRSRKKEKSNNSRVDLESKLTIDPQLKNIEDSNQKINFVDLSNSKQVGKNAPRTTEQRSAHENIFEMVKTETIKNTDISEVIDIMKTVPVNYKEMLTFLDGEMKKSVAKRSDNPVPYLPMEIEQDEKNAFPSQITDLENIQIDENEISNFLDEEMKKGIEDLKSCYSDLYSGSQVFTSDSNLENEILHDSSSHMCTSSIPNTLIETPSVDGVHHCPLYHPDTQSTSEIVFILPVVSNFTAASNSLDLNSSSPFQPYIAEATCDSTNIDSVFRNFCKILQNSNAFDTDSINLQTDSPDITNSHSSSSLKTCQNIGSSCYDSSASNEINSGIQTASNNISSTSRCLTFCKTFQNSDSPVNADSRSSSRLKALQNIGTSFDDSSASNEIDSLIHATANNISTMSHFSEVSGTNLEYTEARSIPVLEANIKEVDTIDRSSFFLGNYFQFMTDRKNLTLKECKKVGSCFFNKLSPFPRYLSVKYFCDNAEEYLSGFCFCDSSSQTTRYKFDENFQNSSFNELIKKYVSYQLKEIVKALPVLPFCIKSNLLFKAKNSKLTYFEKLLLKKILKNNQEVDLEDLIDRLIFVGIVVVFNEHKKIK
ncbi:uncharacterized protein [Parasteatoda tepidariorum]|uniref:uncharacterized protein isoform X1 n=1 Tax=Parasteatoda tepidariorum TaxID=114398 RepID=UPI001C71FF55|nr:uncharacterized protein LOC122271122 [Parasteatoda tepidariorum]